MANSNNPNHDFGFYLKTLELAGYILLSTKVETLSLLPTPYNYMSQPSPAGHNPEWCPLPTLLAV